MTREKERERERERERDVPQDIFSKNVLEHVAGRSGRPRSAARRYGAHDHDADPGAASQKERGERREDERREER